MRFGNFYAVYIFWLIPILFLFYLIVFSRRRKAIEKFAEKKLLKELIPSLNLNRRKIKITLIFLSIIFIIFPLMRPQWGFHWRKVEREGLNILIAIDTSKSMLAEDVRPNRLERAKLACEDFVKRLNGDRIGLIAFAGTSFLQCPLTLDYNGFLLSLHDLSVYTIPRGGTSISSAIILARKSYKNLKNKILIIITDGEDHEGNPVEEAKKAKKEGMKIFCIGIGTEEGELIPITDKEGHRTFLRDKEGNVVKTRLDETTLEKIALASGGSYVHATGAEFGLNLIYNKKLSKLKKVKFKSKMVKQYEERFQIPLALALLLLFSEGLLSERKRL